MSEQIKNGGPAFPYSALAPDPETRQLVGSIYLDNTGMTLRDYFAAKAMQGLFAVEANPRVGGEVEPFHSAKHSDELASAAYRVADAMIAAREKQS